MRHRIIRLVASLLYLPQSLPSAHNRLRQEVSAAESCVRVQATRLLPPRLTSRTLSSVSRPVQYSVVVRALGFAVKRLPVVVLSGSSPDVDVGVVTLTENAPQLETQAVTAQRQEVQIQPDRTTYVVHDMPTTKGGTALDVLRNIPSVDVDIDNNMCLRGNTDVVIEINGRPSALKGSQLGNFLDQLPADAVDHLEIIPNPSAREDAAGVAGIINIVLRQRPDAGTSGWTRLDSKLRR